MRNNMEEISEGKVLVKLRTHTSITEQGQVLEAVF